MEVFTAPALGHAPAPASQPPQPQTRDTDPTPRTAKFLDAATIDDEDLFLGDDAGDDVENDIPGEDHDEAEDDDEDDGLDEDYFASTYRPLSNLPTPPPSSRSPLVQPPSDQDAALESSLLGMPSDILKYILFLPC